MLFTIYDEKGEAFEVSPYIAKILIVDKGWTLTPFVEPEIFVAEEIAEEEKEEE